MTGDLRELVEAAIGLNVDCGGVEGVHRVTDAVMAVVQPAIPEIIEAWCHDQQHKLATACSVGECTCAALARHFRGQPADGGHTPDADDCPRCGPFRCPGPVT